MVSVDHSLTEDEPDGMALELQKSKMEQGTVKAGQVPKDADAKEDGELLALRKGLAHSPKQVPCSFLYDEKGSALYNQITELEEYYPYKTEIQMLKEHAHDIIKQIPAGAKVVELGCGSATKTSILLQELLQRDGREKCAFIGIDVSSDFLDQAKENLLGACPDLLAKNIEMIQASYLEGLKEARDRHPDSVLCVLWLGSSIGNLDHRESQAFFQQIMKLSGSKTQVLVCTDLWKDRSILHRAYCDSKGVTEQFIKNGMRNALLEVSNGQTQTSFDDWEYDVIVNPDSRQVEMFLIAKKKFLVDRSITVQKGERILMEVSRKFLPDQLRKTAYQAGFIFQAQWKNNLYSMQMICAPEVALKLVWADTDYLFSLVRDWSAIPISLRHPFCFYYGHIAGFAKIKLLQNEPQSKLDVMFSRGIDPDVGDPEQCHCHPEIPDAWPNKPAIIAYAQEARSKVLDFARQPDADMWRMNLVVEHECMHQETLCYMLAQSQKQNWEAAHLGSDGGLLVQNGVSFQESFSRWAAEPSQNKLNGSNHEQAETQWTEIPFGEVILGTNIVKAEGFAWDNEGPRQAPQDVKTFQMANTPVSIAQFRDFVLSGGYKTRNFWTEEAFSCIGKKQDAPATWTITADKDIWIHTPEGTHHWTQIQDRPVFCCLAEAQAYCKAKGHYVASELEYLRARDFDPTNNRIKDLGCNGWELTSTMMEPLTGFEAMIDYPEYSSDFYDGKHYVLRGSSPYTPLAVVRASFRNFYQDVYPFHFAKFRCCSR